MKKEISAKLNNLRIAPRKVRLVADLIRGKNANRSLVFLNHTQKKAAGPMAKLLQSAIANAKNNFQIDDKNLRISKITVDEGQKLKRWRPRSMGRAFGIQKKTSHITLILTEQENTKHKIKPVRNSSHSDKGENVKKGQTKIETKNKKQEGEKSRTRVKIKKAEEKKIIKKES
jgi:large subunit ribosomal protein L22